MKTRFLMVFAVVLHGRRAGTTTSSGAPAEPAVPATLSGDIRPVHDPTMVREGDSRSKPDGGSEQAMTPPIPIRAELTMALLYMLQLQRARAVIHVAVAVIAVLAVATPASADAAQTPPGPAEMGQPSDAGGLDPDPNTQQPDICPRPEAGSAFVYRNGDFRSLRSVRGAEVTVHLGINDRRQTTGFYAEEGAELGPDCIYPLETVHGFIQDRWGRVTTIDVPGGDNEFPEGGINDRGQVADAYIDAGAVPDPDGVFPPRGSVHGFIRDRYGRITTFDVPAPRLHAVTDINDHGLVVGYVDETFTSGSGFVRDPDGTITRIEVPGASYTEPRGITNDGRIVGSYETGDRNPDGSVPPGRVHGFIWDDGRITTFDVPGSLSTVPTNVNNRGDIVGGYRDGAGRQHGFLLRRGRYTTIDAPGRPDGNIAWGINDRGDIVIPEPSVSAGEVATGQPGSQRDTPQRPRSSVPGTR